LLKSGIWIVISGKKGESFMLQKKIPAVILLLSVALSATVPPKRMAAATAGNGTGV
jgi:hypothetical protein